jgi:putative ABC transport system substrate-binding protein
MILLGGAVTWPCATPAQQKPMPVIGFLGTDLPGSAAHKAYHEAFLQGLRALGHIEGGNVVIEYRYGEGENSEQLPALATELVALRVDVIVAVAGTLAALAAKQATDTIPVVFIAVGDPVTSGLVSSLPRPGGNMTGLSAVVPDLVGKWLEILKQAAPDVTRVAFLRQPGGVSEPTDRIVLAEAADAARALGVQLQVVEARGPDDLNRTFLEVTEARAEGLAVLSTPMLGGQRTRLVDFAVKNRLPTVFPFRSYVDAGGLISYGPNVPDMCRRAATYVDKILKGARPADLPVEQPTKFELVLNLKTAKTLGLSVPHALLSRADEVLE